MGDITKIRIWMISIFTVVAILSSIVGLGSKVAFAQQNDVPSELIDFVLHSSNNLGSGILDIGRG